MVIPLFILTAKPPLSFLVTPKELLASNFITFAEGVGGLDNGDTGLAL